MAVACWRAKERKVVAGMGYARYLAGGGRMERFVWRDFQGSDFVPMEAMNETGWRGLPDTAH